MSASKCDISEYEAAVADKLALIARSEVGTVRGMRPYDACKQRVSKMHRVKVQPSGIAEIQRDEP